MKKLFIPILVLLNLAVSCDKGGGGTVTPTAPDTAMKLTYSIGSTDYNLTYLGAARDTISTPNQLIFSGTTSRILFYPSLAFTIGKPASGWQTQLTHLDKNNPTNFVEMSLSSSIKYSSVFNDPSDSIGMNINFSKFSYVHDEIIEGTFNGSLAPKDNSSQIVIIKNGKFRLRVN